MTMKTSSKKWQKIRKIKGLRQFVTWYPRHVSENPGFYISKFNDDAFRELGYGGPLSKAMDDLSVRITGPGVAPNAYLRRRRDEFDVFFDNGRVGQRNRKPTETVKELYGQWNIMEFEEITEIVKSVLDGTMEETQVINLDVDGEKVSEYDVEQYLNFDDNTAALNKTVKSVIERTYSKKKVDMLKRLYAYRCQICGQNVGEEHGVNIAEAHHIKYFSKSIDNSSDNLLILCPNHHSLIHALNPKFDYDELQYIYPDGKTDKIILDLHLTHGKEEE